MGAMREGDLLVHHPYDSFATSVERFVEQAVADPNVLAIKQTVYRTSDDSPLVPALIDATERGKQAVALVELQARFDERMNIHWAKALEEAGVHVVYGQPALKTHAKCVLVVRREGDGVRNYVHIGTGNYHSDDRAPVHRLRPVHDRRADRRRRRRHVQLPHRLRAPAALPQGADRARPPARRASSTQIERTIAAHSPGTPARIAMKMNALVDGRCIRALYAASQAGVHVDLNVRGICCLRPGCRASPRTSASSRSSGACSSTRASTRSSATASYTIYIASADLMPRNLDHRVELAVPIEAPDLRAELLDTLERAFADNQSSWELDGDGVWHRRAPAPASGRATCSSSSPSCTPRAPAARATAARPTRYRRGAPQRGAQAPSPGARDSRTELCDARTPRPTLAGGDPASAS